jgi:hypothetical protein
MPRLRGARQVEKVPAVRLLGHTRRRDDAHEPGRIRQARRRRDREMGQGGAVRWRQGGVKLPCALRRSTISNSDAYSSPPPPGEGEGRRSRSRDAACTRVMVQRHEILASNGREAIFLPPLTNKGGGAPRDASNGSPHRTDRFAHTQTVRRAARATSPFPARLRGRIKERARSPFGAPPRLCIEVF